MAELKFIVTMDTSQFTTGANKVMADVKQITSQVEKEGGKIQKEFDGIGKGIGNSIGKYIAAFGGAAVFKGFISEMVKVRSEFQKTDVAIQTMLGSKDKADQLLSQVREYAKISPLEFGDITRATQMMISFNIEADKVPKYIKAIGDVSMGEKDRFNSLALAFSQMSASGKLMGQDLMQMINAGFNPLATMAEKTGKSIGELKEEMSKGAISAEMVQQAFIDATSAGGKFFNMSENAAKTIGGQLSMLSDAIDNAFNEIGTKGEGIIAGAINAVTKMVENYETIGKVVLQLVQIYGTYKAALLVNEALLIRKTAIELAAAKGVTVMQLATDLLRKKMEALNLTMMKNPYVLIASVVITAATAFALWSKSADSMTKATEKLNDAFADTQAKIQEEQAHIDNLFGRLRKAKEGTAEYKQVKEEIISQYGQYLAGLDAEIVSLRNVEGAYKAVARAAREAAIAEGKAAALKTIRQDYGKAYGNNLEGLRETLKDYKVSEKEIGSLMTQIQKDLSASGKITDATQKRILSHLGNYENVWNVRAKSFIESLNKNEKSLTDATALVEERFQAFDEGGGGSKSGKSHGRGKKEIQADIDAAQAELDGLTKQEALGKRGVAIKKKIAGYRKEMQAYDVPTGRGSGRGGRGGGGRTTKKDTYQEEAEQRAKLLQLSRDLAEQREREERTANDALADARVAAIKHDGERERKAEELEHNRRLREIREQADEFAKQQYENKKKVWEATHKKGVFEDTEEGLAGWEALTLTPDQQKIIAAQVDEEESRWEQVLEKRRQAESSAMNDYLINYGTYLERRYAITQKYEKLIEDALYEGDKKALEKQRDEALSQLDFEQFQKGMDWSVIFGDLNRVATGELKEVRAQLQMFKKDANYYKRNPDQIKVIEEAINRINKELAEKGGLFGGLVDSFREYEAAVKAVAEAEEQLKNAVTDEEKERARLALTTARQNMNAASDTKDKAVDATINKTRKLMGVITELGNTEEVSVAQLGSLISNVSETFGEAAGKIGGIIGSILALLDSIGNQNIDEWVKGIANKLFTAIGQAFNSKYSLLHYVAGGLMGASNDLDEDIPNLINANNDLESAIRANTEALEDSSIADIGSVYKNAVELMNEREKNMRSIMQETGSTYSQGFFGLGGKHSAYSYINDALSSADWARISKVVGKNISGAGGFFSLSSEDMKKVQEQATDLFTKIKNAGEDGYAGVAEYMDEYITYFEEFSNLQSKYFEKLTSVSLDSVVSDFSSALADMDSNASDFADKFEDYMRKAIINALVTNQFKPMIEQWYKNFAKAVETEGIDKNEQEALRKEWDAITEQGLKLRDQLRDQFDWGNTGEGSGAYKAASSFSQEQGDELNGRLTAIQIGQAYQNEQLTLAVMTLQSMSVVGQEQGNTLAEMRNLMLIGNGHLEDIARYTRIASQFGAQLDVIAEKIKTL